MSALLVDALTNSSPGTCHVTIWLQNGQIMDVTLHLKSLFL